MCEVLADGSDCDTLECQLDILASSYTLTIEMFPQGGEYAASVTVVGDDGGSHTPVKDTQSFNVELAEGVLMFVFNGQGKALGMQVRSPSSLVPLAHNYCMTFELALLHTIIA